MQKQKILITGATGLVGTRLTELLLAKGYAVAHLGRSHRKGEVPSYTWNIEKGHIDEEAFVNTHAVVHLAGAGVADKPWTPKRKLEILESRTKSTALLASYLQKFPEVKTVVAASAIGYYGFGLSDHQLTEESNSGNDFLAQVVRAWEAESGKIILQRLVKLRIGIVLSEKGGALKEMAKPVRWGVGSPLGTGRQYLSWIHLDDLCNMFIKAIEDESMRGVYNATGPYATTNRDFTHAVANVLNRPVWLPSVPSFVLKALLGEMADLILNGSVVSSTKIQRAGFVFKFNTLEAALQDLLKR